ncbi:unnamed protein product [Vitrella brassicaformis CCMP3155]|uniref:Uncharacterized protein n=1 Tax=Vitrella brassicaformis (strain CCMP3155) TaxID=1169540 RepID=A0A0G4F1Q8_VITBC|nr:unnamed protein product [Vitrella brassicaformis CCMP3155]|eukprot:CEM05665.1 unnamed protein product [Vitrella brassicaformis CCMP3155]
MEPGGFRDDSSVGLSSHNALNTQHNAPMPRLPAFPIPRVPLASPVYGRPPRPPPHLPHLHPGIPSHVPGVPPSAARIRPHPIYANPMASSAQLGFTANRPPFLPPQSLGVHGSSVMAAGPLLRPTGSGGRGESVRHGSDVGDEVAVEGSVQEVVESLRTHIEQIGWAGRVLRDEHSRALKPDCEMPIQTHNNEDAGQEDAGGSAVERLRQAAEKVEAAEASLLSAANTLLPMTQIPASASALHDRPPSYRLVKLSDRQPPPEPPAADRVYGNVDASGHLLTMHSFWQLAKAAAPHFDRIVFDYRCRDEWEAVPPSAAFEIGKRAVNLKTVVVRHPFHSPHWWIGGWSSFIEGHSRGVEERRKTGWQGGGIEELVFVTILAPDASLPQTAPHTPPSPITLLPSFNFPALKSIEGADQDHRHLFDSRRWRMPALERFEGGAMSFGAFCGTSDRLQSLDVGATVVGNVAGVIEGFPGEGSSKLERLQQIRGLVLVGRDADSENIDRLRDALKSRGCSKVQHLGVICRSGINFKITLPTLRAIEGFLPAAVPRSGLPTGAELSVSFKTRPSLSFDMSLLHRIPAPSPLMKDMLRQLASPALQVMWAPDVSFIEHPTSLSCEKAFIESIRFNSAFQLTILQSGPTLPAGHPSTPDPHAPSSYVWSVIDYIAPSAFPNALSYLTVAGPFGCAAATRLLTAGKVCMTAESRVWAYDVQGSEALDLMRAMGSGTAPGVVQIKGVAGGNVGGLDEWARASAQDELPKTDYLHIILDDQLADGIAWEQLDTMLEQIVQPTKWLVLTLRMRDEEEFLAAVKKMTATFLAADVWTVDPSSRALRISRDRT